MNVEVGILDLSLQHYGVSAQAALQETLLMAQMADACGFARFWVTEHHHSDLLSCTSPLLMMGVIAAQTSRCKIGAGGLLLSNHDPMLAAEQVRMLDLLFPGRIEIGIGRSEGGYMKNVFSSPGFGQEDFQKRLALFLNQIRDDAAQLPYYLLGSSLNSALAAAESEMPYVFANFLNASQGIDALAMYSDSANGRAPNGGLALFVACHEDPARLAHLEAYTDFYIDRFYSGNSDAIKSTPFSFPNGHRNGENRAAQYNKMVISGALSEVKDQLQAIVAASQARHLLLIPSADRLEDRLEMVRTLGALNQ